MWPILVSLAGPYADGLSVSMADPGSRGRGLDPSFISAFVVMGYGVNAFTVREIIVNNYLNDLNEDQNL